MQLQWYPGHMHKAAKEIRQSLSQVDMFIEIVDARIPYSSENPMIEEIRGDKTALKILTKSDLADPELTEIWQQDMAKNRGLRSHAVSFHQPQSILKIKSICRELFAHKLEKKQQIHALVVGIPNVGKSTIINILAGRQVAKTGNEPAVTKHQQKILLDNGVTLVDTPGMLWPNVENYRSGERLGITGAMKDTVLDYELLAEQLLEYCIRFYSGLLKERYNLVLPALEGEFPPQVFQDLLKQLAKQRGAILAGGRVDIDRISKILVHEFREGSIGRITLETPEMRDVELRAVEIRRAEKLAKKEAKKASKKGSRKRSGRVDDVDIRKR
jgi:ribosome biogenesis GTPase A